MTSMETMREQARKILIDKDANNMFVFMQLLARWTPKNVCAHPSMQGDTIWSSSFDLHTLSFAAQCIDECLTKDQTLDVLEIGCGSGHASCLLWMQLMKCKRTNTWLATDILSLWDSTKKTMLQKTKIQFLKEQDVQAVVKYGRKTNTLLLVAPLRHDSPNFRKAFGSSFLTDDNDETYCGCSDYYASKMFIEQHQNKDDMRFIIFLGELGVSHGSSGMYTYLLQNPCLKLLTRRPLSQTPQCHNEIFVFQCDFVVNVNHIHAIKFHDSKQTCCRSICAKYVITTNIFDSSYRWGAPFFQNSGYFMKEYTIFETEDEAFQKVAMLLESANTKKHQ